MRYVLVLLGITVGLAATAASVTVDGLTTGQTPGDRTSDNLISKAQRFVRTVQPQLNKPALMRITIDYPLNLPYDHTSGSLDMWVVEGPVIYVDPVAPPTKTLFKGRMTFVRDGHLAQFRGETERTRLRREPFDQQIRTRSDWSDAQAIDALEKAGAAFSPRQGDAFKAQLRLDDLEPFMGKLTITQIEFHLRHEQTDLNGKTEYLPGSEWKVDAQGLWTTGQTFTYRLAFEPFEGRLLSVLSK